MSSNIFFSFLFRGFNIVLWLCQGYIHTILTFADNNTIVVMFSDFKSICISLRNKLAWRRKISRRENDENVVRNRKVYVSIKYLTIYLFVYCGHKIMWCLFKLFNATFIAYWRYSTFCFGLAQQQKRNKFFLFSIVQVKHFPIIIIFISKDQVQLCSYKP